MLSLVLALALTQAEAPPAALPEPPRELRVAPQPPPPEPPSVWTRALLGTGLGTLAGPAAFGISYLLVSRNPNFDLTFATAALSSLLISGVAFSVHSALGGRGEVTLGFLATVAVMAGAAGLASAIDSSREVAPLLTVAIGSLPAAALAMLALEGTNPQRKPARVQVAFAPTGLVGRF
ncbi:MAG: hypothetical protein ACOZQL_17560 [Myxococcota bacterium]